MRVAFCTEPPLAPPTEAIRLALAARGHEPVVVSAPGGLDAGSFDVGIVRYTDEWEGAGYRRAALVLEAAGVPFLNGTRSLELSRDKLAAAAAFEGAGLRHPRTWPLAEAPAGAGPLVVKPVVGSEALGVAVVADAAAARAHAARLGRPCLVQELVPAALCIRVLCTPGRPIRFYAKEVGPGEEVASISNGAGRRALPDAEGRYFALAAAALRALGGGLMGLDLLETGDGLVVLEANGGAFFDPDDAGIAEAFVDALEELGARGVRRGPR